MNLPDGSMTSNSTMKEANWHAIYTRSRHEKIVDEQLRQKDVECFLPLHEVMSQWSDRRKLVRKPLFPGYLFVCITMDDIYKVLDTRGVVRLVGNDNKHPSIVPPEQIQAVKRLVESGLKIDSAPYLKEGMPVRIKHGPLRGLEGILVERRKKHRLIIAVDIIRKSASVEVMTGDVEPI